MGRKRVYNSAAERQQAYRNRLAERSEDVPTPPRRQRAPSRPAQLLVAISIVRTLQAGYELWRDRLPESLAESDQATKVGEAVELLEQAADLLECVDLPRGFGRD